MFDRWLKKNRIVAPNVSWSLALVMDTSGSMCGQKLTEAKKALHAFLDEVDFHSMAVSLSSFGDRTGVIEQLTSEKASMASAIESLSCGNGTPFLHGMKVSFDRVLSHAAGNRVMVIASDGQPTDASEQKILDYGTSLKSQGIKIITISIGRDAHTAFLEKLASSPQDFHLAASALQLMPTFQRIARGLVVK